VRTLLLVLFALVACARTAPLVTEGPSAPSDPAAPPSPPTSVSTPALPSPIIDDSQTLPPAFPEQKEIQPASELLKGPEYENAVKFDKWVNGLLSPEDQKDLEITCKKNPKSNLFCPSIKQFKKMSVWIQFKRRVPPSPEPKVTTPVPILLKDGKVVGFKKLRKESIPSWVKGLLAVPNEQIPQLAEFALKEKYCPNPLSVSLAATLEEGFPDNADTSLIVKLYEKGARCFRPKSADRDNFLTRAGLLSFWKKDDANAERLLSKVIPKDAFAGRALYWLYRAKLELGKTDEANAVLSKLVVRHPFSFHAVLAQTTTNLDPAARFTKTNTNELHRSKRSKKANVFVQQIESLRQFGFDSTASLLVDWTLEHFHKLETEFRLYLAELGDAHTKVATMINVLIYKPALISQETLSLAYPKVFFPFCEKHKLDLNPFLLLAVARKESQFEPRAISPANAQGLLQINPDTGAKLTGGKTPDLIDPETNIMLGAQYLSDLLKRQKGQLPMVLASYNAGEDPVANWKRRFGAVEPVLFIDLIPYRETREYVGYVLTNYFWYRRL
jgi:soluble lytic murein transglycosylase